MNEGFGCELVEMVGSFGGLIVDGEEVDLWRWRW